MPNYTQEENLLIQSYFTISFLTELESNGFLKSDFFKDMRFEDVYVKSNLPSIGIANRGTLLIFLYTMLVLPKQLLEAQFPKEFENLNSSIEKIKSNSMSTYQTDKVKIDYVRHMRNSVAHTKVKFNESNVIFEDENKNGDKFSVTIPLRLFGRFLAELQKIFFAYIKTLQAKYT